MYKKGNYINFENNKTWLIIEVDKYFVKAVDTDTNEEYEVSIIGLDLMVLRGEIYIS